jgi:hypothetical protein
MKGSLIEASLFYLFYSVQESGYNCHKSNDVTS